MAVAADYNNKVQAYFVTTLGRPATSPELAQFSEALVSNTGSVWTSGLVTYLTTQNGFPTGTNYGQIVTDMYTNLTGAAPALTAYNFYVGQLSVGSIKLKGLANAILNDNGYMPKNDGTYGAPAGWVTATATVGSNATDLATFQLKIGAAATFTAALDTAAENTDIATTSGYTAAKNWLTAVVDTASAAAATTASANTAIAAVSGAGSVGQTFTLTADIDSGTSFTGGTGNDTFNADETSAAKVSLADTINGGGGTDTLNIYNSKGVVPTMSNIEVVNLIVNTADQDFSAVTGITSLTVDRDDASGNTYKVAGAAVTLKNLTDTAGNDDTTINYGATATSATLTLETVSMTDAADGLTVTGTKLAALSIATATAASTIDTLDVTTSADVDNITITGSVGLTVTSDLTLNTNATSKANAITSTGLSGDLSLSLTGLAANQNLTIAAGNGVNTLTIKDVDVAASATVTLGSGKDVVTLTDATGSVSFDTGAGNDTLTISELDNKYNSTDKETASFTLGAGDDTLVIATGVTEANLASGVTIAGGDGTDTLDIFNAEWLKLFDNATADVTVSGMDTLKAKDAGTYLMSKVSGLTALNLAGAASAYTVTGMSAAAAGAVSLTADPGTGVALSFALTTATGTSDVLGLTYDHVTAATAIVNDTMTVTGFETVNLVNNNDTGAVTTAFAAGANVTSVTVTGTGTGTNTINTANLTALTSLDASAAKGVVALTTAASQAATFSTGESADTVTLTASTGAATINLNGGNDSISSKQADLVALAGLNGGAGTDTVKITDTTATTATLTIDDKAFKSTSGMEAISFTGANAGDFGWVLGGYANAMATANSGVITATATANVAGNAGDDINVDASGLSGTNALKLTLTDTAADATDAIAITITGSDGADTLTITEATAASVALITVTSGNGADTVTTSTAGTGKSTITTGAGNDTISATSAATAAGKGAIVDAGAGDDTITVVNSANAGGDAVNTVTGGTGVDSITLTGATGGSKGFSVNNVITVEGDSTASAYDTVTGFFIGTGAVRKADTITFTDSGAATAVAGNTAAADGSDYGTIKSHKIATGLITFDDVNTWASALTVSSTNLADVLGYLGANVAAGDTVAFTYDAAGDSTVDGTFVFQGGTVTDSLIYLVGVTGTNVTTTAATTAGSINIA